ncbi:gluconokinase [Demequina sediminicola]|uniref:gluconokinase n=1 Tax=Demequina sediminicola TaxID=1095026 RepID=UPI0007857978|nr:gluconokinase [Demequina sediminicola]
MTPTHSEGVRLPPERHHPLIVIAGPTASGKSTIGAAVAQRLSVPFVDGDDLHSAENKALMASGVPLTDGHRAPWLATVSRALADAEPTGGLVVACSALAQRYRDAIRLDAPSVWFAVLQADEEELARRSAARTDHFMPPELVRSQLDLLEPLAQGEHGSMIDTSDRNVERIVDAVISAHAKAGHAHGARPGFRDQR